MAALDISPTRVRPSRTQTITFIGTGTAWKSGAPVFTPTGVSGVSAGSVTVVSDTVATAPITYGSSVGTISWADSTTAATRNQIVSASLYPKFIPRRP